MKIIVWHCQAVNGRLCGSRFLSEAFRHVPRTLEACEVAYYFLSFSREAFVRLSRSLRKGTTVKRLYEKCNPLDDCSKPGNRQISRNMQISRTFGLTRARVFPVLDIARAILDSRHILVYCLTSKLLR